MGETLKIQWVTFLSLPLTWRQQAKYYKWNNHSVKADWISGSLHGGELSWTSPLLWVNFA